MALALSTGLAPTVNSPVTVLLAGTPVLAAIYADALGTPLGNPFVTDLLTGAYAFWADNAVTYEIVLGAPGLPTPRVDRAWLPTVIFSGTSPLRTASLVVEDPLDGAQIILAQVSY